jgi:hypothetical protein
MEDLCLFRAGTSSAKATFCDEATGTGAAMLVVRCVVVRRRRADDGCLIIVIETPEEGNRGEFKGNTIQDSQAALLRADRAIGTTQLQG